MLMRSPNGKQRPFKHLHPMPNMPLPKCLALGRGHSYSEHLLPSQWLKEIIPASQYCFILFLRIKLSFLFMHSFIFIDGMFSLCLASLAQHNILCMSFTMSFPISAALLFD